MHTIGDIEILIPLLALISYAGLYLIVTFSKPQTVFKRAFRLYLLTMFIWSLAALLVDTETGDTFFWFKVMSSGAVVSMLGMFHFVQTMLPHKVKWESWVYVYGVLAVILTMSGNLVIDAVWFQDGILNYTFTMLLPLVAGPSYLLIIFTIYELAQVYRQAKDAIQSNRYRYLFIALALIPIGSLTNFTPLGRYPFDIAANTIAALLISYAILRHQLLDVKLVIRRSMLYAIPTAMIGAIYFLIISLALNIIRAFTGLQLFYISLFVAIFTALVAQPFRDLAQAWIDRLFFRERYDSSRMLQTISQTASTVIDLDKLTRLIMDEVSKALHVEKAVLFLQQGEGGDYRIVDRRGEDLSINFLIRSDHPLIQWFSEHPQPLTWQDLSTMPWFASMWEREMEGFKKIGAELFIPMTGKDDLVGFFVLGPKRSEQPYSYDDQVTLMTLANNTAMAIQNAQLYSLSQHELAERRRAEKGLQLQLRRLSALQNINLAITTTIDLQIPLLLLLEQVVNELEVDAADILLLNTENQYLEYVAARGFQTDALKYTRLEIGEGLAGRAAEEKQTIHVEDMTSNMTSLNQSPLFRKEKFISYFGVPLISKGEVKGVLEIFHRSPLKPNKEWLNFLNTLTSETAIAVDNAQLFKDLEQSNVNLTEAYETTLEGWARTLELRDHETEGHSQRVAQMTLRLAGKMGMKEQEFIHIQRGSLLHDIGKMGIPDNILLKEGPLSKEEWTVMHRHPIYAYDMLSTIPFLKRSLDIPYCHHEKWDGSGYPHGLKGKEIPLAARIFAIIDVWDALCSDRPYRKAWTEDKAIAYIREQSGTHFDPEVVKAFLEMIGQPDLKKTSKTNGEQDFKKVNGSEQVRELHQEK